MKIGFWTPERKPVGTLTIDDKVENTGLGRLFVKFAYEYSSIEHGDGIAETKTPSARAWDDNHLLVEEMAKLVNVKVETEA